MGSSKEEIVISRDVVFDEDFHDLEDEDISFSSSPTSIILNDDTTSQPNGGQSTSSSLVPESTSVKLLLPKWLQETLKDAKITNPQLLVRGRQPEARHLLRLMQR